MSRAQRAHTYLSSTLSVLYKGYAKYPHASIGGEQKISLNQGNHHKKRKFKDEYIALLEAFEIDYDETYLFDWID